MSALIEQTSTTTSLNGPDTTNDMKTPTKPVCIIDEETLTQLVFDTSADAALSLVAFYVKDAKVRTIKLLQAAKENDYYTLEFEAHTLGSSAAAHGNSALSQLCRRIERFCLNEHFDQAIDNTAQLENIAKQSFLALEMRLQQGFRT